MILSAWLVAITLKAISVGTGYAIKIGIGAAGTAVFVMILFAESPALTRITSIMMIIGGIISLKVSTPY